MSGALLYLSPTLGLHIVDLLNYVVYLRPSFSPSNPISLQDCYWISCELAVRNFGVSRTQLPTFEKVVGCFPDSLWLCFRGKIQHPETKRPYVYMRKAAREEYARELATPTLDKEAASGGKPLTRAECTKIQFIPSVIRDQHKQIEIAASSSSFSSSSSSSSASSSSTSTETSPQDAKALERKELFAKLFKEVHEKCLSCNLREKGKLLLCGGCKNAKYCSADCQRKDRAVHKAVCKRVQK